MNTRNQLERITDQELERTLRICKEYLIGSMPEGPFRLFHKSFADFLLDDKENTDYHIDAIPLHKRIVNYYKDNKDSWKDVDWKYVDDYGLRYLSIHAYELRDVKGFNHQLYDLICEPAKLWKFDSPKFFLEDIALAIQAAHDDKTT